MEFSTPPHIESVLRVTSFHHSTTRSHSQIPFFCFSHPRSSSSQIKILTMPSKISPKKKKKSEGVPLHKIENSQAAANEAVDTAKPDRPDYNGNENKGGGPAPKARTKRKAPPPAAGTNPSTNGSSAVEQCLYEEAPEHKRPKSAGDDAPTKASASSGPSLSEEEEAIASKYCIMLKARVPKDAVRHKMNQEGVADNIVEAVLGKATNNEPSNAAASAPHEQSWRLPIARQYCLQHPLDSSYAVQHPAGEG